MAKIDLKCRNGSRVALAWLLVFEVAAATVARPERTHAQAVPAKRTRGRRAAATVDAPQPASAPTPPGAPASAAAMPTPPPLPVRPPPGGAAIGPAAPISPNGQNNVPEIKPFETGLDYRKTSPAALVTFNLEDASLTDLVRLVSQITGQRFILPGTTRAIKATVYAPTKVSAAEAYQAFLSILELNGMAVVPAGRYLKIVESGRVEGRPIPLYTGAEGVPDGDRFVTRLQRVTNISSEDAATLLERFKSGDGSITAYAPTNMLIVTDTGTNIRRMLRILNVIDVPATGEQIWVEPVHHASATDVASRLTELFEPGNKGTSKGKTAPAAPKKGAAGAPGASETVGSRGGGDVTFTKILADERTNSLIIVATERAYLRILEMLKFLDVSMEGEGKIHVHPLQHSDAEEMATTLQALIAGKGGGGGGGQPGGKGGAAGPAQADVFEGKVSVTAHKASNALVITSSGHDYASLRPVIEQLDTSRRQVFIEAVIMELSVNRSRNFGVAFHGGIPDLTGKGSVSVLGFQANKTIGGLKGMAADPNVLSGLAVGVQGPIIQNSEQTVGLSLPGFGVAVNALASTGDANILSTPHLIATDNVEASISVGQNVPLQTQGGLGGGLGGLGGLAGALPGQTGAAGLGALGGLGGLGLGGFGAAVPRQDVGTTVTITPHVNDSSEIRLQIQQEISSAGAPSSVGVGAVSIDRTKAKTEVVVRDQQTVVIGGLMRDQVTTSETKVPVLGDIPLIGALFRKSEKQKIKKNLLLFLTPYIIRSPDDLRSIYERKMRERQEFLDRYFVFSEAEYETPLDYSRTRGLVGEIMLELKSMDERRLLAEQAAKKPEIGHSPQPAIGQLVGSGRREDQVIEPDGQPDAPNAPPPPPSSPPEAGGGDDNNAPPIPAPPPMPSPDQVAPVEVQ